MTIESMIGTVLLRVSGGKVTSDLSVTPHDVKEYLPAAINYALNQSYWANVDREMDHEVPGDFVSEFSGLAIDRSGDRAFVTLPKKKINLGNNRGIRFLDIGNGIRAIPLPQGMSYLQPTWNKVYGHIPFYEEVGQRVYLSNVPMSISEVSVGAVTAVSDMEDTDELPIAAGYEPQVIDILVKFFTDSRFTPKDYIINGKDIDL